MTGRGVDPDHLEVTCGCERSIVLATRQQIADGVRMSCGVCAGTPATVQARTVQKSPGRPECGTTSGYNLHVRRGTPPCGPCREAIRAYQRAWKAQRKVKKA